MDKNKIGITDIAEEISRKQSNSKISSADSRSEIIKFRDFIKNIENNKKLEKIFTTSQFVTDKIKDEKRLSENLQNKIITLLSPSQATNPSIGRLDGYKKYKKDNNEKKNLTLDFRAKKYKEEFKKAGLLT